MLHTALPHRRLLRNFHERHSRYRNQIVIQNDERKNVLHESFRLVAVRLYHDIPHLVGEGVLRMVEKSVFPISLQASRGTCWGMLTLLMILPIAEPIDSERRITKRKMICVLTIRSTAVRLIGVALS